MKSAKRKKDNKPFYILIALVAIGGIGALTYVANKPSAGPTVTAVDTTLPPVKSEGYVIGSPTAPLEVIEFGDFECPQCSRFATLTEPDVRKRLIETGRVRLRYIDFPLQMHPNTWNASRAAACADEQGKFWPMHDAIYGAQDKWEARASRNPDKIMKELAKQIGLNTTQFDECVDTKKYQAKVQAHAKIAEQRRVGGTPTFVFGSEMISDAMSYDEFKKRTDDALTKMGSPLAAPSADTGAKGSPAAPAGTSIKP